MQSIFNSMGLSLFTAIKFEVYYRMINKITFEITDILLNWMT